MDDPKKYFVYIVSSRSGTLYIGMTNNIERRMREHKSGEFEGFASDYACDRLAYYESFDDVQKAIGREKQLKGWVRRKKIALIESVNPTWQDLAEKWGAPIAFAGQSTKQNKLSSLSGVVAARSAADMESKDPMSGCGGNGSERDSHDADERIPFQTSGAAKLQGVLRVRWPALPRKPTSLRMTVLQ